MASSAAEASAPGLARVPGTACGSGCACPRAFADARLLLRYRNRSNQPAVLEACGLGHGELALPAGKDFSVVTLALGAVAAGAA